MTVFDFRKNEAAAVREKLKFELKTTLFVFRCRYLYAIARRTGIRLPFRLISLAFKALLKKRR